MVPAVNSFIKPELKKHLDEDVKLVVTICVSEFTRMTAPKVPCNDDIRREAFQLIVESFQGLEDTENPSFAKRVKILEIVARVKSCVVMIDLDYEDLILEMLQHFWAIINE